MCLSACVRVFLIYFIICILFEYRSSCWAKYTCHVVCVLSSMLLLCRCCCSARKASMNTTWQPLKLMNVSFGGNSVSPHQLPVISACFFFQYYRQVHRRYERSALEPQVVDFNFLFLIIVVIFKLIIIVDSNFTWSETWLNTHTDRFLGYVYGTPEYSLKNDVEQEKILLISWFSKFTFLHLKSRQEYEVIDVKSLFLMF